MSPVGGLQKHPRLPNAIALLVRANPEMWALPGIEPERVSTCNSFALMARLVAGDYGVAIMPPAMSQAELKART